MIKDCCQVYNTTKHDFFICHFFLLTITKSGSTCSRFYIVIISFLYLLTVGCSVKFCQLVLKWNHTKHPHTRSYLRLFIIKIGNLIPVCVSLSPLYFCRLSRLCPYNEKKLEEKLNEKNENISSNIFLSFFLRSYSDTSTVTTTITTTTVAAAAASIDHHYSTDLDLIRIKTNEK